MTESKIHGHYGPIEDAIGEVMSSTFKNFEFELHRLTSSQSVERGACVVVNNESSYIIGVITNTKLVVVGSGSTRPLRLKSSPVEIDQTLPDLRDRIYNSYDATIVGEYTEGDYIEAEHTHHAIVHAQVYSMDTKDIRSFTSLPCDYLHLLYENGGVDSVLSHLKYLKNFMNDSEYEKFVKSGVKMLHIRGFDDFCLMVVSLIGR